MTKTLLSDFVSELIFIPLSPGCYPFYDDDPFVINKCPHVYFAGNSHSFQHTRVQGRGAMLSPKFNINGLSNSQGHLPWFHKPLMVPNIFCHLPNVVGCILARWHNYYFLWFYLCCCRREGPNHASPIIAKLWPHPQLRAGQLKHPGVWRGEVLLVDGAEAEPRAGAGEEDPGRAGGSWCREDTSLLPAATGGGGYVTTETHGHGWGLWWLIIILL